MKNKNLYINGNTALNIDFSPNRKDKKDKEFEDFKRRKFRKKLQQERLQKTKVVASIIIAFTLGLSNVYRYSTINRLQKSIGDVKTEIDKIDAENEDLMINLLQYNKISFIENYAINELEMVIPSSSNTTFVNLQKDNFISEQEDENNQKIGVLSRIKSIFN
jgi:cell division protein FtsL